MWTTSWCVVGVDFEVEDVVCAFNVYISRSASVAMGRFVAGVNALRAACPVLLTMQENEKYSFENP
jgi:hypothetical protein